MLLRGDERVDSRGVYVGVLRTRTQRAFVAVSVENVSLELRQVLVVYAFGSGSVESSCVCPRTDCDSDHAFIPTINLMG